MEEVELRLVRGDVEDVSVIRVPAEICDDFELFLSTLQIGWTLLPVETRKNLALNYCSPKSNANNATPFIPGVAPAQNNNTDFTAMESMLRRVLSGEDLCFRSPTLLFHSWLKSGFLVPAISRLMRLDVDLQYSHHLELKKKSHIKMLTDLSLSRNHLLRVARFVNVDDKLTASTTTDSCHASTQFPTSQLMSPIKQAHNAMISYRAKNKYAETLIRIDCSSTSEDETDADYCQVAAEEDGIEWKSRTLQEVLRRTRVGILPKRSSRGQHRRKLAGIVRRVFSSGCHEADQSDDDLHASALQCQASVGGTLSSLTGPNLCALSIDGLSDRPCNRRFTSFFHALRWFLCTHGKPATTQKIEAFVKELASTPHFHEVQAWSRLCDNWLDKTESALKFLSGAPTAKCPPNFVTLVDFKEKCHKWSWMGTVTDSKDLSQGLKTACDAWLNSNKEGAVSAVPSNAGSPLAKTDWQVCQSTSAEKAQFHSQENARFAAPDQPFTYDLHGFQQIVGPIRGFQPSQLGKIKAREHKILVKERLAFINVLTLVRDAVARLPNGQGTRNDICQLLRDSKYIRPDATTENITNAVSGALDRLHCESDPCTKYDSNQKLWIYLHRDRTELDFKRLETPPSGSKQNRKNSKSGKTEVPPAPTPSQMQTHHPHLFPPQHYQPQTTPQTIHQQHPHLFPQSNDGQFSQHPSLAQ